MYERIEIKALGFRIVIAVPEPESGVTKYIQFALYPTTSDILAPSAVYESIRSRLKRHPFWSTALLPRFASSGPLTFNVEVSRGHSPKALYGALKAAAWDAAVRHKRPGETMASTEYRPSGRPSRS